MRPRNQTRRIRFLLTAGGTREYIDPVRFISNASSGKMGYSLAKQAATAGHKVTLITASANLPAPKGAKTVAVESAADMFRHVRKRFDRCDCLIMAAAVSDYTPSIQRPVKIKKKKKEFWLKLRPTVDILDWAGRHKRKNQLLVGFALENEKLKSGAERKLRSKNLDMVVANRPSAIGADNASVWIKTRCGGWLAIKETAKAAIARKIIQLVEQQSCP